MRMATRSATSTTNSERNGTVKAFATLRIAGDQLQPDQVTRILKIILTKSYAKGNITQVVPAAPT